MKGLAQSPLFLTQPVRGGEGGRAQERNREIGHSRLHPCKKSQGEQYTFRSGGPTILHFSHREDRFLHRRKERQKSWPLCRKDLDLYGLLAVLDKGLRCSAPNPPEKQRILIHRLIQRGPFSPSCLGCQITAAECQALTFLMSRN